MKQQVLFGLVIVIIVVIAWSLLLLQSRDKSLCKICYQNLQQIDRSKSSFAAANRLAGGTELNNMQVKILCECYIPDWPATKCLEGGEYDVGRIGEPPSCSIHGVLPVSLMQK